MRRIKGSVTVAGLGVITALLLSPASSVAAAPADCAWPVETTPTTSNIFYPDSNSTYWTSPYRATSGTRIYLRGTYPSARFFAITAYDNATQPYSVNGVSSSLTDYEITPSSGRNPWSPSSTGAAGGRYEITLRSLTPNAGVTGSLRNTLPILPAKPVAGKLPSDVGFLMVRVYLPPGLNFSSVPLPSITIKQPGKAAVTLKRCAKRDPTGHLRSSGLGKKILKLLAGKLLPAPKPCPLGQAGCPPNMQFFVPAGGSDIPFPNVDSGYAAVFFQPEAGKVVVIKAKLPTSPYDYGTVKGESPVPWPRNDDARWQVRYWSFCNYVYQPPYPVVVAAGPNGSTIYGCAADLQTATPADGTATVVVSMPADRPSNAIAANGITWLPMSTSNPSAIEQVSLRNMLTRRSFKQTPKSATGESVSAAESALGPYYPQTATCTTITVESGGPDACFASG